jgi:flagellin-like protein
MPKKREKKGVSAVITTVLIIAIVVVLSGIIFIFAKSSLEKAKEEALGEKLCSEVEFSVADFCHGTITSDAGEKSIIRFNGINEANNLLDGFLISLDYGGEIISVSTLPYSELENGQAKTLNTEIIETIENIKQIKIIPRINNNGENIICDKNTETFDWSEVKIC